MVERSTDRGGGSPAVRSSLLPALLAGTLIVGLAGGAQAGLVLTLDDLSTSGIDVIVVDEGPIGTNTAKGLSTDLDGGLGAGLVSFAGAVGAFVVNVSTGISKPFLGGSDVAVLDLNSINVNGGTIGTIEITLTDTDFVLDGPQTGMWQDFYLKHNIGGTTTGVVTSQVYIDSANQEFGQEMSPGPCGEILFGNVYGGSCVLKTDDLAAGPFSLSQVVRITHDSIADITSFDSEVRAEISEPASLAIFAAGLLGLGVLRRRRATRRAG
jgi:hypothetical protein